MRPTRLRHLALWRRPLWEKFVKAASTILLSPPSDCFECFYTAWVKLCRIDDFHAASGLPPIAVMGLTARDKDGKLHKTNQTVRTGKSLPSQAIRAHHKSMLMRAHHGREGCP